MQSIHNIAEICAQKGVRDIILSPGSRCAPLTLAFVRHPLINTKTISDERSAGFIALGISQQTKRVTGLVCTSGSAAYNYAPAIAEAYYQQIPLLILTADRPPEWIDQLDGQTIRQENIYGKHVKASYTLPVERDSKDAQWHIERTINEAINMAQEYPYGPVHINIPLREPFYPESPIAFDKNVQIIEKLSSEQTLSSNTWDQLCKELKNTPKVLIVGGQTDLNQPLNLILDSFSIKTQIPVIGDIISNLHTTSVMTHHDIVLSQKDVTLLQNLRPDLIITFGKSLISKSLKQFLRNIPSLRHWHIQEGGYVADTFQHLTRIIPMHPLPFFKTLHQQLSGESFTQKNFFHLWQEETQKAAHKLKSYFKESTSSFNEFKAIYLTSQYLPQNSLLHLANSMPVRYVNYLPLFQSNNIEVFANRGTSGIDGVISTALGAALSTNKVVTVITGDMSFFYDSNAFWNNYAPANFRIVILNNHGGGIFRIIEGPHKQPELEEYFETKQKRIAENLAKDYNLDYTFCTSEPELKQALNIFYQDSLRPKILEIETNSKINAEAFHNFKKLMC